VLVLALFLAATGLAACGGTSSKTVAERAPQPTTASQTPTDPSTSAPKRPAKVKQSHHSAPQKTTAPASGAFFAPSAARDPGLVSLRCLRSTGLKQARHAVQANVWEGALSKPDLADPKRKVFVDGPYRTAAKASLSANQLNGVEYSASGGRWVVSASLQSRLSVAVRLVAACLASSGSARSTSASR
jgi:hypothetical protein